MNFRALSLSYRIAPIEIRENIALEETQIRRLLIRLQEQIGLTEALILSTCNRTEVYYTAEMDWTETIIKLIGIERGISEIKSYLPYFQFFTEHKAVEHLFEVAVGLDSQVIGDLQILNQVKRAYQCSADANMAGAFLHRLLHTIFFTNKKIVQQTAFRDGAASVSYATVEMVERVLEKVQEPKILIIGLGEIGEDVARNLKNTNLSEVYLCNRTFEKAEKLALELGFQAISFEKIAEYIQLSDVIVSAVSSQKPLIRMEDLTKIDFLRFKHFFDLGMPRSIAENVEDIHGALLYHIDMIQNRANEALQRRLDSVSQVRLMVEEAMEEFGNWTQEMMVSPTIQKIKNALEQIRQEELSRYTKQLDSAEYEKIDKITKSIMQKIIKLPVLELKAACKRGEADTLVDVLSSLFDLEKHGVRAGGYK